jgi:hypothetical protein
MWRSARASSTVVMSMVLALASTCSSSPNGPPGASADAGTAADAPLEGQAAAPEVGGDETGVGLGCPASFTGRAEGTPCFSLLTGCDYPEGRCGCLICEMGAVSFGYAWSCRPWDSGGNGCPARSPTVGDPCDVSGLVCRYAAYCSVSVGDDLECKGGAWQAAEKLDPCGYRSCPF